MAYYDDHKPMILKLADRFKAENMPKLDASISKELAALPKEQQADALNTAQSHLGTTKEAVAQAPDDGAKQAILSEHAKLIQERADIANRGLSTGERIAMAVLGAAPAALAAAYGGNVTQAVQAGNASVQNIAALSKADMQNQLDQKDVELKYSSDGISRLNAAEEKDKDRAFNAEQQDKLFKQQAKLKAMEKPDSADPEKHFIKVQMAGKRIKDTNPKNIEMAQKALTMAEQLNDLITSPQQAGFNDLTAVVKFIQNLDGSVVRADDRAAFQSALGFLQKSDNFFNKLWNGEQLGKEGREKLNQIQQILARSASKTLKSVVTPAMVDGMKKAGFDDTDIQMAVDHAVGGMTPFQRNIYNSANEEPKKALVNKPKSVIQNGHTFILNEATGEYE